MAPQWFAGELVPISRSLWARGGVDPGQVASPSQGNTQTTMHTLIHTPKGNLERPINLTGTSLDCGRKLEYPDVAVKYQRNFTETRQFAAASESRFTPVPSSDRFLVSNPNM
ncbi:hypothetical protein ILYODFUR_012905 [Ilyodon furcidens]|uniref:Uncharacterized protein n=1 Tax=Ilyodon furcidens TaxID=33524 RepID=A0ABV0TJK3_9TELE